MKKKHLIMALFINAVNAIAAVVCLISFFISFDGGFHFIKSNCFAYFTNLSAALTAVASVFTAFFCAKNIRADCPLMPKALSVLKLAAATAESVTFEVVLFMQLPARGLAVYARQDFFLHLFIPLTCFISYAALEKSVEAPRNLKFWGMLPSALYTVLYTAQVLVFENWKDFYALNTGGFWYVSVIMINGTAYLFASLLWLANHNKKSRKDCKAL